MTEQEIASFLTPDEVAVYSRLLHRQATSVPISVYATIAELRRDLSWIVEAFDGEEPADFADCIKSARETLRKRAP